MVREEVQIEAPYVQALPAVERRLGLAAEQEGRCLLILDAPFGSNRILTRTVEVRTSRLGEGNFTARFEMEWDAGPATLEGFPTPAFDGIATVRAGEDYNQSDLLLEGTCAPPGGPLGSLFNELAGRHITHAALHALLDGVKRELEIEHRAIEHAKQHNEA